MTPLRMTPIPFVTLYFHICTYYDVTHLARLHFPRHCRRTDGIYSGFLDRHLIIADHFFGFKEMLKSPDKAKLFEIVIQLGAILAVGFLYRRDLFNALKARDIGQTYGGKLRTHLLVAFLPVAVIGFLFHKMIT